MVYIGVYTTLCLLSFASIDRASRARTFYNFSIAFLFLFVAFRYQVGCDWTGYLNIYQIQGASGFESAFDRREYLFWLSNALLHAMGLDYPLINVIAGIVYFSGFHLLARRQPNPIAILALSFPLLVLHLAMSGIRQAMAIGFICAAINAFNDRRPFSYVALIIVAGGFHTSSLIFLALAPFVRGAFTRRNMILAGAVALPGLVLLASGEQFSHYYDRYVGTNVQAAGAPFRTALLSLTGALFILVMKNRWARLYPGDLKLVSIGAGIMLLLFPLTFVSSVIADRLAYYLMPVQLIILARFSYVCRGMFSPVILLSPFAVAGAVLVVWISISAHFQMCYVPYNSWLLGY